MVSKEIPGNPILINGSHLGKRLNGIGIYVLQLLKHWVAVENTDLLFAVYLHEQAKPHFDQIPFPKNFQVHWINSRCFPDTANLRRLFYSSLLAAGHPRSVIFNPSQLEATCFGARQVVTVMDLIPLLAEDHPQRKQHCYFRFVLPRFLARASAIITPSQVTKELLNAHYGVPAGKVTVIPLAVRSLATECAAPRPIGGRKYILFAGRIVPYRNVERLVQAFMAIRDRVEHDLVLAGEVFYDLKLPDSGGRIKTLGYVTDGKLAELYRDASVFVFPTLMEGFGLPPLEAMAYGVPVVASREASLPEVCSGAAVLVDPRSVESIGEGLVSALLDENLRSRLVAAGRQRVSELTWEKTARAHLKVFEQVLHQG